MTQNLSPSQFPSAEHLARRGNIALVCGIVVLVLQAIESTGGVPGMPRFWHQNQYLWFIIGLVSCGFGCHWLWQAKPHGTESRSWKPSRPGQRFRRVVLYTRTNCPLCDEAAEVLAEYSAWLPLAHEVDIDSDPELVQKFTTCVPVVECDGRIRFRGRIEDGLLRRLIEGTSPIAWP